MHLKIKTPAKINLTLDILGVREDGFHDIASIMQTISLYDFLTFDVAPANELSIELSGTNPAIPYNEKNLVHKAIRLLYDEISILPPCKLKVFIEKNIPTEAGLGGGSSNAAGTIWALNKLFNLNLSRDKINSLCGALGSDLNVCYWGGTSIATSRGEKVASAPYKRRGLSIIKPVNFGISAKDGYKMFDELRICKASNSTYKILEVLATDTAIDGFLHNDLEIAPLNKFEVLRRIKEAYPNSVMTGSGSAFFVLDSKAKQLLPTSEYQFISGLEFISTGIEEV